MRIYADSPWEDVLPPARPQWAIVRSLVDPLAVLLTYWAALLAFGDGWDDGDAALLVGAFLLFYPGKIPFRRFSASVVAQILCACCAFAVLFLVVRWAQGRTVEYDNFDLEPGAIWTVAMPFVLVAVHAISPRLALYLPRLCDDTPVVIVGVCGASIRFAEALRSGQAEGQRLVGCFEDRAAQRTGVPAWMPVSGGFADIPAYVKGHGVGIIYICLPMTSQPRLLALLHELRDTTASVCFIPDIFVADLIQGSINTVGGLPVVSVCDTPFRGTEGDIKRSLDIGLTLAVLPVALPLMFAIALAIRWTSPGPVLFKQRRYGLDGKEILVWKFRTMHVVEDGDEQYRQVTLDDERVTPLGRLLRRTSLDELPQLLNVLGGSMSLVGPRPHAMAVNEQYRKVIPGYMIRHKVRPGITGWAQVNGYRGGNDLDSMRKRTEYDLAYLRSWSLSLDLLILLRTARMLLVGDSRAY